MTTPWSDDLMPGRGAPQYPAPQYPAPQYPRPPAPPTTPGGRGLTAGIVALVVVVMLGVLAVPVSSLLRGGKAFWPNAWDPRIAPIAIRDEQIRGLNYDHPVAVRFLPDAEFKKLANGDGAIGATERAEVDREAATFRALGFIDGNVDLLKVTKQASDAGVLAFYDFNKKEIVVRGTTLDVSHRATLAHELTHVLQDQHFDIRKIEHRASSDDEQRGGSSGAMLALIEGDANRVGDAYVKGLSADEQAEYNREQVAQGSAFGKATPDVPPFVQLIFAAPYELGPLTIRMLIADGGNAAVNKALTGPTPTSADFVQAGLVAPPPPSLRAPTIAEDEEASGPPEAFGAFELYVMLAARDDPSTALRAADAVLGGRAQGLRWHGRYCYRAMLTTRDVPAAQFVQVALQHWTQSASGASVNRAGTIVAFTACDPGAAAVGASKDKLNAAELLLGARSGLAIGAAENGVPAGAARCVARLFALRPGALDTLQRLGGGSVSPQETLRVQQAAQEDARTCRDNPKAGLL
jgi:hypothetical protein